MKKRALSLVMAAAVAGTMLTGCGSTEGEKTADKNKRYNSSRTNPPEAA